MIDLHCHSTASDGLLDPEELLHKAIQSKISMLALTDHDTTDGLSSLYSAAQQLPIHIICGIEISVCWKKHDIHILGLNIDPEEKTLLHLIAKQRACRMHRAVQIGACLEKYGIKNAHEKASLLAGHERIARPHFAKLLVEEGLVKDIKQAFSQFLARGRSAYVPTLWADITETVEAIVRSGGQAVLAHPLKYKFTRTKLLELLTEFKNAGGVGMEVVSGPVTQQQALDMANVCARFELLASTGSDFHGDDLSPIGLGQQRALPLNCIPVWSRWTSTVKLNV